MRNYVVTTALASLGTDRFVVPIDVRARSFADAASQRFRMLAHGEPRENCAGLCVTNPGSGESRIFAVDKSPRVNPEPSRF